MVVLREEKVERIADSIPLHTLHSGPESGEMLVVGRGSTYDSIKSAVSELQKQEKAVAHAHIRHLRPFPKNLGEMLRRYKTILVPELNDGQLVKILRDKFLVDAMPYNGLRTGDGGAFEKCQHTICTHAR